MIVVICGLPGTGKTTLANSLAPLIDAAVLSTDKIRKELISKPTYTEQERKLIYDVIMLVAGYLHSTGANCILDATFISESSRKKVKEKLNLSRDQIRIVECICPENAIISRLKDRKNDYSDADFSVYLKMKQIYEPVKGKHLSINTSKRTSRAELKRIADNILMNTTKIKKLDTKKMTLMEQQK